MRIAIDLNGVLRDTITKFTQIYEKYLIESENNTFSVQTYNVDLSGNTESIDLEEDNFVYEILSDVTSLELEDPVLPNALYPGNGSFKSN